MKVPKGVVVELMGDLDVFGTPKALKISDKLGGYQKVMRSALRAVFGPEIRTPKTHSSFFQEILCYSLYLHEVC